MLYKAEAHGKDTLIYTLFEHQSDVHELMPLRLLGYVVRVLDHYARNHDSRPPLVPVVSVVLHHSEEGWTGARTLLELFDPEALTIDGLPELLPNLRFVLDDISHSSDEVLWASSVENRAVLIEIFRYISSVGNITRDDLIEVAAATGPDAEEVAMTLAEQLWEEGRIEGRKEGIEKGRRERREDAERHLLKLLKRRFGEIPESAVARLDTADTKQLSLWTDRVLDAEDHVLDAASIDEVLR